MSLLFNMLSRFVITFLPRSKRLLISWLQSPSAVILEPKKIAKSETAPLGRTNFLYLLFLLLKWLKLFLPCHRQQFCYPSRKVFGGLNRRVTWKLWPWHFQWQYRNEQLLKDPNNPNGVYEAVYKQIPSKILMELKKAVQKYEVNSPFTLEIVQGLAEGSHLIMVARDQARQIPISLDQLIGSGNWGRTQDQVLMED